MSRVTIIHKGASRHLTWLSSPSLQLENIGIFIEGCKKYGMTEKDLFVTLDLHEQTNRNMVRRICFVISTYYEDNYLSVNKSNITTFYGLLARTNLSQLISDALHYIEMA